MDGQPIIEIERPRSAFELIGATFGLYRRYSWLFLVLAGVVVVPYELISLIGEPGGPLHGAARALFSLALNVADFALVLPLISALHVFAVEDVRAGREPDLGSVARRGLASLRVVSPAVFLSYLGIFVGFIALIVPGILLAIRWAVVAQAGSLGAKGWRDALDHSAGLTEGRRLHVFGIFVLLGLITSIPTVIQIVVFGAALTVGSFVVGTAFSILLSSFTALTTAFLYFDLKARFRTKPAPAAAGSGEPQSVSGQVIPPNGHPLDPESWSDEDRPAGWYVVPDKPWRMRYWAADDQGVWSQRTAKTPKATLEGWRDMRGVREKEDRPEGPA